MTVELAAKARAFKEDADRLLEESDLLDLLHEVGDVRLTGAYAYGVMLDADIDIDVVVPAGTDRSAALALLDRLIRQNWWTAYTLSDHREKRVPHQPDAPRAYYVGVKTSHRQLWWKVDIWLGDADALTPRDEWVRQGMDAGAREVVLSLKDARVTGRIHASGLTIYAAVIRDHVETVEEFVAWQHVRTPA